MSDDRDVLVIGGGIAGAAAAVAAAQQGARVLCVRAGPGASALCLGGWRGSAPAAFTTALARAGLALEQLRCTLPRPDGAVLDADAAPRSHMRAALSSRDERTLVCSIEGLPGFHAPALAALWADAAGLPAGSFASAALSLTGTPAAGWSPVALAALLEREPLRVAEPLAAVAQAHGAARAIVPAILGLEAHVAVHARIEAEARVPVGEALGAAPSLPGWRLDVALRAALAQAGVEVIGARVTGRQARTHRIESVSLNGDGGARTIHAASVVLATGKFIGGGVAADPHFVENALGCDVALQRFDRRFDDASWSLLLTADARADSQPLLEIGVRTDAEARPLSDTGDVLYSNVFVAGSVRAGASAALLGLGHAATDGWNAGTRAAALASVAA
jgi:glycerol-3-phosphate dehydrogenase subunit B